MTTDLERKPARGSRSTGGKAGDEPVGKPAGEPTSKPSARKRATPREQPQDTPGASEPGKAQSGKARADAKPKPADMPLWERIVGAVGALLVLAVLGLLVYDGVQPASAPALTLEVANPTPQAHGFLVIVAALNTGATTAAGVTIEGTLTDPARPDAEPVETSQFTLDYVPDHSRRSGGLVFTHDPAAYRLDVRVLGYSEP